MIWSVAEFPCVTTQSINTLKNPSLLTLPIAVYAKSSVPTLAKVPLFAEISVFAVIEVL